MSSGQEELLQIQEELLKTKAWESSGKLGSVQTGSFPKVVPEALLVVSVNLAGGGPSLRSVYQRSSYLGLRYRRPSCLETPISLS